MFDRKKWELSYAIHNHTEEIHYLYEHFKIFMQRYEKAPELENISS